MSVYLTSFQADVKLHKLALSPAWGIPAQLGAAQPRAQREEMQMILSDQINVGCTTAHIAPGTLTRQDQANGPGACGRVTTSARSAKAGSLNPA
jgi:hypothetical protein